MKSSDSETDEAAKDPKPSPEERGLVRVMIVGTVIFSGVLGAAIYSANDIFETGAPRLTLGFFLSFAIGGALGWLVWYAARRLASKKR